MEIATCECPSCHAELFEGARFCIRCGSRLEEPKWSGTPLVTHSAAPLAQASVLPRETLPIAAAPNTREPEASLFEIDADFGALAPVVVTGAPPPLVTIPGIAPQPAAPAPSFGPAASVRPVSEHKPAPGQADEASPRRQSIMTDLSRDEVLRRARAKQSLKRAGLAGVDLSGANLEGVDFGRADLEGANLQNAKLSGAVLKSANLRHARLKGADLGRADLDKADLEGADLDGVNLAGANLTRATLESAVLAGANLTGADLSGAELTNAVLEGAVLNEVDARHASFEGAKLERAVCRGAKVGGASFAGARLADATFAELDTSPLGDGSTRLDGARALAFVKGEPFREEISTTRYFGKGDVLRDATLEFGPGSRIQIDSRFDNCSIALGEGAELTIGESGVLDNCAIAGRGKLVVHGRFFERQTPGIVGIRSLVVSARGGVVGGVEQVVEGTQFAFEPGCRLRVKILRTRTAAAAE